MSSHGPKDALRRIARRVPGVRFAARKAARLGAIALVGLAHVRRSRDRRLVGASGWFDRAWYLAQYPDVEAAGIDPLGHYLSVGGFEGRDPGPRFDSDWYLEQNADVAAGRQNPLVHFLRKGQAEGRSPVYVDERSGARFLSEIKARDTYRRLVEAGPLVSVVLATRDRRDTVMAAIASVLGQSYRNVELLVVDDGSRDGTADAVAREIDDPRLKLFRSEPQGVSAARNIGLRHATGEYIAYIDSDNSWTEDFLAVSLAHLIEQDAEFCYAGVKCMIDEKRFYFRFNPFDVDKLVNRNFIDLNVILHHRALYDRNGGFDESLRRMVDWDLIIRFTRQARVTFAPFIGTIYDDGEKADRITKREGVYWKYVILNKHKIDWPTLRTTLASRDPDLVSVVIPVFNQAGLTEQCLQSLFAHEPGARFEIVIVDNGSEAATVELLDAWQACHPEIRLVRNAENLNFALGCNLGFAASRGSTVVFLNNDTLVEDGWLVPLVAALRRPEIGAVQPKLVYPDGSIQCIGVTFSRHSAVGYPIYAHHPGGAAHVNRSTERQAVTAACMAVRAADFAALDGFDCRFINGQEDVDFCLRLKRDRGLACWYAAESEIVHQESKTPGRGLFIKDNRRLFCDLWQDGVVADDAASYERDGFRVVRWDVDNRNFEGDGLASYRPRLLSNEARAAGAAEPLRIAIKIGCPSAAVKDEWGDYHFAVSLKAALERLRCRCRIDFLNEWDTSEEADDVNLVLRGLSEFRAPEGTVNLMWLISHPDKVGEAELARYDHVFVASTIYAARLEPLLGGRVSALLQCTDKNLFRPQPDAEMRYEALFVGNSRNVFRPVVREALDAGIDVAIFGTRWQQFIPAHAIRGENIPNGELGRHYNSARVVLNDHWPDMREKGFVSNRLFDVLACGVPLVSDEVAGLPHEIAPFITAFGEGRPLKDAVAAASAEGEEWRQQRLAFAHWIHEHHSFDQRAQAIAETVRRLLEQDEAEPIHDPALRAAPSLGSAREADAADAA